ncbi:MAG: DUF2721 domain-containing protein [Methylophilaceae bacterium]
MQTIIHSVSTASEAIQQSVAPVFLLMGVSTLLGVLTGRLGRVVDRFRELNEHCESPEAQAGSPSCKNYKIELQLLATRAHWVQKAIALCTLTLLLVALIIAVLFLGVAMNWHSSWLVPPLFIATMLSLVVGLGCFLHEIYLSNHTFKLR